MPKLIAVYSSLLLLSIILAAVPPCRAEGLLEDEHAHEHDIDFSVTDVSEDIDGFHIDPNLVEEVVDDSLRSRDERLRESSTTKQPFERSCPYGYFVCTNGECIAQRWRCDGHYDCDDFSDELNCTTLDIPQHGSILPASGTYVAPPPRSGSSSTAASASASATATATASAAAVAAAAAPMTPKPSRLEFNSSVEPLMIFSTGSSIRGYWMRNRIYFDVVTRSKPHSPITAQTSITDAFSLLFGMLGGSPSLAGGSAAAAGSSRPASDSVAHGSKPETTIVGLDMDPNNREVFWVELGKEPGVYSALIEDDQFEARHKRQHRGSKKVVEFGLLSPEDIAIDTIGRNIYITDAGLPAVVVCSYTHVHCRVIVEDEIHKPRAIIVDSATGWVIFSDWGDRPGLYLVSMDGRRRETLIDREIVWPNGLALDSSTDSLYWADARLQKVERVDLKTRRREIIIRETNTNPFSVSMFENRIYWSDWSQNEIKTCNKFSGNDTRVLMHAEDIYGIHIYHPDLHHQERHSDNPCWSKHCSHLCLLTPGSAKYDTRANAPTRAVCSCPDYMTLSVFDKATCIEMDTPMVMANVRNYIATFWPNRIGLRVVEELVTSKVHAIQDVASDWHRSRVYFYDASAHSIMEADLSGRRASLNTVTLVPKQSVRGLTYDWMSDNLYWLDHQAGSLIMYSFKGDFQRVLRHGLARPTSLSLDTKNRVMYIACVDNTNAHILRTDMLASEQSDVVLASAKVNGGLGLPVALYLDEQRQKLYWADAKEQTVESIELDIKSHSTGTRLNTRTVHRRSLGMIVSFTIFQDSLIWMVSGDPYLHKARLAPSKHSKPVSFKMPPNQMPASFPEIDYRRLITVELIPEAASSPCHSLQCSHGCVLDSTHDPKCICPDGFKLSMNNRTNCIEQDKHEECQNCLPAVVAAMQAHVQAQSMHTAIVPGAALSNIMKHLDGSSTGGPSLSSHPAAAIAAAAATPVVEPLGPPEHKKFNDSKHEDWIFEHSLADHHHQPGESAAVHSGAFGSHKEAPEESGNKMVWLIVFILMLSAAGLVTMLSLLMLHKQGRLHNPVTVSFIAPDRDKDRAMLLLDTDVE